MLERLQRHANQQQSTRAFLWLRYQTGLLRYQTGTQDTRLLPWCIKYWKAAMSQVLANIMWHRGLHNPAGGSSTEHVGS